MFKFKVHVHKVKKTDPCKPSQLFSTSVTRPTGWLWVQRYCQIYIIVSYNNLLYTKFYHLMKKRN